MRKVTLGLAVVGFLGAGAGLVTAGEPAVAPAGAAKVAPAKQVFGKAFTVKEAPTPVQDVMAKSDAFDGKTVKISGVVTKVCQAKGCWFEVAAKDGQQGVRIKSADYSIFVPKDSAGRHAVVEGTLKATQLSVAAAQHLAQDGAKPGEKAPDITAPQREFQVAATAVEFN
jgi:hypothetical protein